MKKNGFTLAEVLITLMIIGVIATVTLPSLMTNTQEQQAKTALKKGINTLTEAAQMNQAIEGYDYASLASDDTSDISASKQSLYALLANRASIDYTKSGDGKLTSYQGTIGTNAAASNYAVFFRDGTALSFNPTATTAASVTVMQNDGLVYGIPALFDTNGAKGPNILSNCSGIATGVATDSTSATTACTPAKRVIKDQFGVRLRGGYAVPNGAAARWAFEN